MSFQLGDRVSFGDRSCKVIPFSMADRKKAGFKNTITDAQIKEKWTFVECDPHFTEDEPLKTFRETDDLVKESYNMPAPAAAAAGGRRTRKSRKSRKSRTRKSRTRKSRKNI